MLDMSVPADLVETAAGLPAATLAYIGPGAGVGALVVAIALLLGVTLLVIGLVWYPLKRLLRARTHDAAVGGPDESP
jgi:hypothetical protein